MFALYGLGAAPDYGAEDGGYDTVKAPYKAAKPAAVKGIGPPPLGGQQDVSATTVAFVTGLAILTVVGAAWFYRSQRD